MSPEVLIPGLLIGAGVLFFLLRRWSELPGPTYTPPQSKKIEDAFRIETARDEILITHPLVRRAAEKAFADGGSAARYIRKDGERIYFTFGRIGDPVERQKAIEMIRSIEEGGEVSINEALQLFRRLFSR
jgi:hypothetical protein